MSPWRNHKKRFIMETRIAFQMILITLLFDFLTHLTAPRPSAVAELRGDLVPAHLTHLGLSGEGWGCAEGVRGTAGFGAMLAAGRRPWMMCFCTNESRQRSAGSSLGHCDQPSLGLGGDTWSPRDLVPSEAQILPPPSSIPIQPGKHAP